MSLGPRPRRSRGRADRHLERVASLRWPGRVRPRRVAVATPVPLPPDEISPTALPSFSQTEQPNDQAERPASTGVARPAQACCYPGTRGPLFAHGPTATADHPASTASFNEEDHVDHLRASVPALCLLARLEVYRRGSVTLDDVGVLSVEFSHALKCLRTKGPHSETLLERSEEHTSELQSPMYL